MMLLRPTCSWLEPPSPRSFAGLMELYESNYIRFRRLCPGLKGIEDGVVSQACGALDLHLNVLERSNYTSTVCLTYYLQDSPGGLRANPDLKLRIYHDAMQTHVLSHSCVASGNKVHACFDNCRSVLAHSWTINRFLFKWLGYCLRQGHIFLHTPSGQRPQPGRLQRVTAG